MHTPVVLPSDRLQTSSPNTHHHDFRTRIRLPRYSLETKVAYLSVQIRYCFGCKKSRRAVSARQSKRNTAHSKIPTKRLRTNLSATHTNSFLDQHEDKQDCHWIHKDLSEQRMACSIATETAELEKKISRAYAHNQAIQIPTRQLFSSVIKY